MGNCVKQRPFDESAATPMETIDRSCAPGASKAFVERFHLRVIVTGTHDYGIYTQLSCLPVP